MFPCVPYCRLLKCSRAETAAEVAITSLVCRWFAVGEQRRGSRVPGAAGPAGSPAPSVGAAGAVRRCGPLGRRAAARGAGPLAGVWGRLCGVTEEGGFGGSPEEPVRFQKPPRARAGAGLTGGQVAVSASLETLYLSGITHCV